MDLAADAELDVARTFGPTDVTILTQGDTRGDLFKGKTGVLAFADVFRAYPQGVSPLDNSVGSPLVRVAITPFLLRLLLEHGVGGVYDNFTANAGFMITSGIKVEYDTAQPNNSRITQMTLAKLNPMNPDDYSTNNVIYTGGKLTAAAPPYVNVVSTHYIIKLAVAGGLVITDPANPAMAITPEAAILKRPDGSEIKEWEALARYIQAFPAKTIPVRYDPATAPYPRRMICSGPLCVK